MQQALKILLVLIVMIFASCGGGGGGSSSTGEGIINDDGTLTDVGDAINDQLPGSIFYISETDNYDAVFQLGASVLVIDSMTAEGGFQVKNTVYFDDE